MNRTPLSRKSPSYLLLAILLLPSIAFSEDVSLSAEGYTVKPGDTLQISVWNEPELQRLVLVRPDGGISFPLAGEIQTTGKTVGQIQQEITSKMQSYLRDTNVSVALETVGGNTIYIIGQVNRPGAYTENRAIDVLQALAIAGGTTPFAKLNDILVLRRTSSGQESIRFRYTDVADGRNLDQNITLEAGDTIIVP